MSAVEVAPKSAAGSPPNGEIVVSVRGLTKVFKDFWNRPKARAVDNVDFEVRRSEEHTSELQSLRHLVCRLLLEKKNNRVIQPHESPTRLEHRRWRAGVEGE